MERLLITKPIWFLPNTTREEAARILHNKDSGNFIIRESIQKDTFALSVKLGSSHGFVVHHYIIVVREGTVALEDSYLIFDSIVSLAVHYSSVRDELPEVLSLPDILESADSQQYLISLALLGKSFWSYPMARPGRRSLLISEPKPILHSSESNSDQCEDSSLGKKVQSEHQLKKRTTLLSDSHCKSSINVNQDKSSQTINVRATPTRPPRRSLPISTPSPPLIGSLSKTERMGGSKQFLPNEERIDRLQRHSVAEMSICTDYNKIFSSDNTKNLDEKACVSSPVFTAGQAGVGRKRKQSVFSDNYINEQEYSNEALMEENHIETKECVQKETTISKQENFPKEINHVTHYFQTSRDLDEEDPDYAEPLDTVVKNRDGDIYPKEEHIKRGWKSNENICITNLINIRKQRFSDSNLQYEHNKEPDETCSTSKVKGNRSIQQKKQSLPMFLRKLSAKTETILTANEQNICKQERRISSIIENIMLPNIQSRKVISGSYQVDSSSWEFLNKDAEDLHNRKALANTEETKDSESCSSEPELDSDRSIQRSSSKDSVYQSEFDSTSTMESTFLSLPRSDQDNSLLSLRSDTAYSDCVPMPTILISCQTSNTAVMDCVRYLADGRASFIGESVRMFIKCTEETKGRDSKIVLRNVRQFINGLKNYLVRNGEEELKRVIETERANLRPYQFLNVDSAIEEVLHEVITKPLTEKLCQLFNQKYKSSQGQDIPDEKLPKSLKIAEISQIALLAVVEQCKESYTRMEASSSPTEKLHHYLDIVRHILIQHDPSTVDVTSFCHCLCFLLVQIGAYSPQQEADIMWGLIEQDMLGGEAGFYLALLYSSAHIIRTHRNSFRDENLVENTKTTANLKYNNSYLLPVMFPNERTSSLSTQIVPLRPGVNVRDVRRIIGCQMSSRDTKEYRMYRLIAGKETKLDDSILLQEIQDCDENPVLIYRRQTCSILLPMV